MKFTHRCMAPLLALVVTAGMGATSLAGDRSQNLDPRDFTTTINNPFFPLVPGTTYIYEGNKEGSPLRDVFEVTDHTKVIMGIKCREIHDRVYVDGVLEEDTLDWFAQDEDGNVWYFGEDTKELDPAGNVVSTEGSWEAGVDGALPGIIMEAHPRVGDTYRQEFAPGVAEDMATVLALNKTVKVPFGNFNGCLQTKEFTPLEPDQFEHKYYAAGIGFIRSVLVKGGKEELQLVDIVQEL